MHAHFQGHGLHCQHGWSGQIVQNTHIELGTHCLPHILYGHQLSISLQKQYEILEAATLASVWGAIEARKIPWHTHGRSPILFDWSGLLSARRAHLSALRRVAALLENFGLLLEG